MIGFVEVATVTRLKRFFPEIEKVYEAEVTGCASTIVQDRNMIIIRITDMFPIIR